VFIAMFIAVYFDKRSKILKQVAGLNNAATFFEPEIPLELKGKAPRTARRLTSGSDVLIYISLGLALLLGGITTTFFVLDAGWTWLSGASALFGPLCVLLALKINKEEHGRQKRLIESGSLVLGDLIEIIYGGKRGIFFKIKFSVGAVLFEKMSGRIHDPDKFQAGQKLLLLVDVTNPKSFIIYDSNGNGDTRFVADALSPKNRNV
jgi:hypothetical protein